MQGHVFRANTFVHAKLCDIPAAGRRRKFPFMLGMVVAVKIEFAYALIIYSSTGQDKE